MNQRVLVGTIGACLLACTATVAQQSPGTIAALEFQKPKNGMVQQYEAGRKQKAAWHLQEKDTQALMVWQILTGDFTGTYVVGRTGQHWADFDKPAVPDQADLEEYNKVIGSYVESMQALLPVPAEDQHNRHGRSTLEIQRDHCLPCSQRARR